MGLKNKTSLKLYSYEELEIDLRRLAGFLNQENVKILTPATPKDKIPVELLSIFSGIPVGENGFIFSVIGDIGTDICIFNKIYESSHHNANIKYKLIDIYQESDGSFMSVKLPWYR